MSARLLIQKNKNSPRRKSFGLAGNGGLASTNLTIGLEHCTNCVDCGLDNEVILNYRHNSSESAEEKRAQHIDSSVKDNAGHEHKGSDKETSGQNFALFHDNSPFSVKHF